MIEWRDSDGALANVDEKFWLPPPIHLYFFFPFTSRIFSEWKLMNFFRASSKNFFKSHTWTVLHKKIREYILFYLISRSQSMHGTNLMRAQSLTKEINGRHLPSKNSLFINIWSSTNIALVKWLENEIKSHCVW